MKQIGFIQGNSIIHRLDPRVRGVVAIVFSIVVATSDRFGALVPALLLAVSLILLARLPIRKVFSRLLIVNGLLLFLWLFLPFTLGGRPIFAIGPLRGTREGIIFATIISLKSNAIILALMSLLSTMSIFTWGRTMRHLYVPDKVIHLFFFTYRYMHVIHREYQHLVRAMKVRGFRPGTNMHTYRTYAYLLGMLLVKSHDRAERVRGAMLCRGFQGRFYALDELYLRPSDMIIMVLILLAIAGVGLLQWTRTIY